MILIKLQLFFSTVDLAYRLTKNSLLRIVVVGCFGNLPIVLFMLLRLVYFNVCVHNIPVAIDINGRIKAHKISILLVLSDLLIIFLARRLNIRRHHLFVRWRQKKRWMPLLDLVKRCSSVSFTLAQPFILNHAAGVDGHLKLIEI